MKTPFQIGQIVLWEDGYHDRYTILASLKNGSRSRVRTTFQNERYELLTPTGRTTGAVPQRALAPHPTLIYCPTANGQPVYYNFIVDFLAQGFTK